MAPGFGSRNARGRYELFSPERNLREQNTFLPLLGANAVLIHWPKGFVRWGNSHTPSVFWNYAEQFTPQLTDSPAQAPCLFALFNWTCLRDNSKATSVPPASWSRGCMLARPRSLGESRESQDGFSSIAESSRWVCTTSCSLHFNPSHSQARLNVAKASRQDSHSVDGLSKNAFFASLPRSVRSF